MPLSIVHQTNCRIIAIGVSVSKVKNVPNAQTIIVVGNSHHKMYFIYPKQSMAIRCSNPNDISGSSDSKLKNRIGINIIVILARYLQTTNWMEDIFLE